MRPLLATPLLLLGLLALLAGGCAKSSTPGTRLSVHEQLQLMLMPHGELEAVPRGAAFSATSPRFIEDPADEVHFGGSVVGRDLTDSGWISAVKQGFHDYIGFEGGSITSVELFVSAFEDEFGAQRALRVLEHFALNGPTEFERVHSLPFEVPALGSGAWGASMQEIEARGAPTTPDQVYTFTWVAFAVDNFVGRVLTVRFDEESSQEVAVALAEDWQQRIRRVLAGDYDSEPSDGERKPGEVLALARAAMNEVTTFHVSTLRRVSLNGDESSVRLEYDVQMPDRLQGFLESPSFPRVEVFAHDRVAYYRERDGDWECLSEATSARPEALGFVVPAFDQLLRPHSEGPTHTPGDKDDEVYRISDNGIPRAFETGVPDVLGPRSRLRQLYPEIGSGDARFEFVIDRQDYRLRELTYDLNLTVQDGQITVRNESVFSQFDVAPSFPDVRSLPLCAPNSDPPCKGANLPPCLIPSEELDEPGVSRGACDGEGPRVCIVPFGAVDPVLLDSVIHRLETLVDAMFFVAPAQPLTTQVNSSREQLGEDIVLRMMYAFFGDAYGDPEVTYIALTPVDLYSPRDPSLRFLFGTRSGDTSDTYHHGVISYWRMDPNSYGNAADRNLLEQRLAKMLLKYVLTMHYDYETSGDPGSVLYDAIYSVNALDKVVLEVPPR